MLVRLRTLYDPNLNVYKKGNLYQINKLLLHIHLIFGYKLRLKYISFVRNY